MSRLACGWKARGHARLLDMQGRLTKQPARHEARDARAEMRAGEGSGQVQRLEVYFPRHGYAAHRHDTYAIGMTLKGVQEFRYRGLARHCLPGQCHILYPDELHDGVAASEGGFRYRIAHIAPRLIQDALGGQALPFVIDPVVRLTPKQLRLLSLIWDMGEPIDDDKETEIAVAASDALKEIAGGAAPRRECFDLPALRRVHERIKDAPGQRHALSDLERLSGLDRWTLARQFRAAFGTSPTRFRTMRQLDLVRRLVREGMPLIDATYEAGFSDQCHMSRQFKNAYGLTPARWAALLAA
jgi:AraC-like DNA-binding protein